jgi:hypothetical protein
MKNTICIGFLSGFMSLSPVVAFADAKSAAGCAASLTNDQKGIYQAVLADFTQQANLTLLVRAKVIALVEARRLQAASAPDDAKAAAHCLEMMYK